MKYENVTKNDIVKEIMEKRIKENKELFSKEELKIIRNNFSVVKKIYLLGLINGRDIYKDKM